MLLALQAMLPATGQVHLAVTFPNQGVGVSFPVGVARAGSRGQPDRLGIFRALVMLTKGQPWMPAAA
jgi:hypothetical protein